MIFTVDMVKPLFEKTGMTKEEFAVEAGVGTRTIFNWLNSEQPRRIPMASRKNLIKMWKKYGVEK